MPIVKIFIKTKLLNDLRTFRQYYTKYYAIDDIEVLKRGNYKITITSADREFMPEFEDYEFLDKILSSLC